MNQEELPDAIRRARDHIDVPHAPVADLLRRGRESKMRHRFVAVGAGTVSALALTIIAALGLRPIASQGTSAVPADAASNTGDIASSVEKDDEQGDNPTLVCEPLKRWAVDLDIAAPEPDTTLDEAVRTQLHTVAGERYTITDPTRRRAVALSIQAGGRATAELTLRRWENGGWAVESYVRCRSGIESASSTDEITQDDLPTNGAEHFDVSPQGNVAAWFDESDVLPELVVHDVQTGKRLAWEDVGVGEVPWRQSLVVFDDVLFYRTKTDHDVIMRYKWKIDSYPTSSSVIAVTIAGRLWLAAPPLGSHNPPPGWDENETLGRFTQTSPSLGEFVGDSGQKATFRRAAPGVADPNSGCE